MTFNHLKLKKINGIYVFTDIDGESVLAGRFILKNDKGSFVYGKSYLSNPKAYALDPINLPLVEKEFFTYANRGFFGVLLDAGPDQWGRKVYSHYHNKPISDGMDALVAASGGGVGSLLFSLDRKCAIEQNFHKITLDELNMVKSSVVSLLNNNNFDKTLLSLILDGSSLGGARPKVTIKDDNNIWIAKINKDTDIVNQAKVEHIFLKIANDIGINACNSKVVDFSEDQIIMIKRFDRVSGKKKHFISLQSLINNSKVSANEFSDHPYSYKNFSHIIRKISNDPKKDLDELFKRMIYNVIIHNTDDHAKNHGFLYNEEKKSYELSPAYDLVPQFSSIKKQSLIIGKYGRESSIRNILSVSEFFGKTKKETIEIIKKFQNEIPILFDIYSNEVNLSENDKNLLYSLQKSKSLLNKKINKFKNL